MASNPGNSLESDEYERDDAHTRIESRVVNTQGGDYAEGSIDKRTGTFVEILEAQAYNVSGLSNPYLGLRAFTAAERDIFAGRERMVRAMVDRLIADNGDRLLFIVGASGSGKSSLARAGLLPTLAERLQDIGYVVETRIIDHPGQGSTTVLDHLLDVFTAKDTQSPQLLLLLIDQFEEIFSQADTAECDRVLNLLVDQATSSTLTMRIIVTMRSDFLPYLVADARFEAYEHRKVIVRAMTTDELQDAIQRPIQVRQPDKRIELDLVERLAKDAADAASLPLLQVTLEDLWRGGSMRLGSYQGLSEAIQRRADAVYDYRDHDGLRQERRTAEEQAAILSIFLDLVRVSLDDQQRDVRWRRPLSELTQRGRQREQLIASLVAARLLYTDREVIQENGQRRELETVDIVHEALLTGWPTLKASIDTERERLRQRERFILAFNEWRNNDRSDDYLLVGVRLSEAKELKQRDDAIFKQSGVQVFFDRSVDRQAAEQAQQLRLARRARYLFHALTVVLLCISVVVLHQPIRVLWLREQARDHLIIAVPNITVQFDPYEVSNGRYRLCVDAGACLEPFNNESTYFQGQLRDDLPVTGVDALQAAHFCKWIGARLPSSDEWQHVTFMQTGRGTNAEWQAMINTASFAQRRDHVVGLTDSTSRTPEGIYNLLGNVWEWTRTTQDGTQWNQQAATIPTHLLAVGGSITMSHPPTTLEEAVSPFVVTDRFSDLGFRCVYD